MSLAIPWTLATPQLTEAAPSYKEPLYCGREFKGNSRAGHGWGLDIISTTANNTNGQEVVASVSGTVSSIDPGNGQVRVNHGGGDYTVYAHMWPLEVTSGQPVSSGQLLGYVSNKGDAVGYHLHYGQDERPGSQWVPQQVRFYNQAYNYSFGSPTYGSPRDSVHCPSPPATDIFAPPSVATQAGAIGWLYQEGVTGGCGSFFDNPATTARYCPLGIVTRGEMASFLNRYLSLPNTSTNYFTDISTSVHKQAINNIRAAGITGGCTVTTYCPNTQVTRAQMASFLDRALDLPNTLNDYFTDDNSSPHEQDINNIRAAGITSGCTATTFCPNALVTRGEMAVFLYNGRNLRP